MRLHPFRATYDVVTTDPGRARELAVEEFRRTARLSASGWVRVIVGTDCEPVGPEVETITMGDGQ